jgi:hypothetical protein
VIPGKYETLDFSLEQKNNLDRSQKVAVLYFDYRFTAPVLSPDFLVNYLAIGPVRAALAKSTESILPLMIRELQSLELLPAEVLQAAEELRVQLEGQPPHVIHRRVRDLLLKAQSQLGPMAAAGTPGMQEALRLLITEATLASSR